MSKIKLSIVIPNWNGRPLLEKNLPAVVKACRRWKKTGSSGGANWEIIVVDDSSTDDSLGFLKKNYPQIKRVAGQQRVYFAANCNRGFDKARGKVVVLINNDVSPRVDFLKPLLANFKDESVFAVGCLEEGIKNGKVFWSGRGVMEFKRGMMVHRRAGDQSRKVTDWVCAGSGAYDRKKWRQLGGLDRLFRPAYEEDRDISFRAKKQGWKNLFEPKSVVYHRHETTNIKAFGLTRIKIVSFKNQFLFVWKNMDEFYQWGIHLFWLPYHLTVTNLRSGGLLFLGLLMALTQVPEVIKSRRRVKRAKF